MKLSDLGLTAEEKKEWAPGIGDDEEVHAVMCVLPMGWSHSPLVAQEAVPSLGDASVDITVVSESFEVVVVDDALGDGLCLESNILCIWEEGLQTHVRDVTSAIFGSRCREY